VSLLLDTTVLVGVLRERPRIVDWLSGASQESDLSISTISIAEIQAGMKPREEVGTRRLLGSLIALPVTRSIGIRGGELMRMLTARGLTKGIADMLIAATALEHGLTLVTANVRDFPEAIPGLRVRELS
jgi:predicted nucleic acid-binding protein